MGESTERSHELHELTRIGCFSITTRNSIQ
jgi:hypothetical protein